MSMFSFIKVTIEVLTVIFYTTSGCHLCEVAETLLKPVISINELTLENIDIADSDTLVEQYGTRIPLIQLKGTEPVLGWPFDEASILQFLNQSLLDLENA